MEILYIPLPSMSPISLLFILSAELNSLVDFSNKLSFSDPVKECACLI